jgi:hypothetical protein
MMVFFIGWIGKKNMCFAKCKKALQNEKSDPKAFCKMQKTLLQNANLCFEWYFAKCKKALQNEKSDPKPFCKMQKYFCTILSDTLQYAKNFAICKKNFAYCKTNSKYHIETTLQFAKVSFSFCKFLLQKALQFAKH